jgi:hypothetical protein
MRSFVSSLVRLARWWTFTFLRTAKQAAPEASHSSGSQRKNTQNRQLSNCTAARSRDARCAWTSQRTARASPDSDAISAARRLEVVTTSVVEAEAESPAARAMVAMTSPETAPITIVAATTVADVRRSTSRSGPKAAGAVCAARSAAFSRSLHRHTAQKYSGEVLTPPECPLCCTPKEYESRFARRRVADQPPTVLR